MPSYELILCSDSSLRQILSGTHFLHLNTYLFSSNVVGTSLDFAKGSFSNIFTNHVVTYAPVFTCRLLSLIGLILARLAWAWSFSCWSLGISSLAIFLGCRFLISSALVVEVGWTCLIGGRNTELGERLVVHVVRVMLFLRSCVVNASKFTHFLGALFFFFKSSLMQI